ncbi:MAG: tetratricopeptide repeat protein [Xanthomonadales bacterium]|nr:tetratricopeptide repeat protein [Xanthomonadales bacterium]
MNGPDASGADASVVERRALWGVLTVALLLRMLQIAAAARSPITFNPGADESYYLQFGAWVAAHGLAVPTDFAFMDPAYGYLLGGVLGAFGGSVLAVYLLQAILDVVTTWLIHRCASDIGGSRSGLLAAAVYALCATAIMFTTTALKATLVAFCAAVWTLLALRLLRRPSAWRWLGIGLFGGLIVGVRGNLLLWSLGALVALPWLLPARRTGRRFADLSILALGVCVGLSLWSVRHAELGLGWSPLPFNGGIVLHHTYNPGNPRALMQMPEFVNYRHPLEIWHGYAREAERLHGRPMSPREVSAYWQGEALNYLFDHPAQFASNALRKLRELVAAPEIPNNRIYTQERALSPVLSVLPAPFPWLFGLGCTGLVLLVLHDRRTWAALIPLAACVATALIFFPEDRFRFHGVPTLAIGAGFALDRLLAWWRAADLRRATIVLVCVAALVGLSFALGRGVRYPERELEREAWGYLRMGQTQQAETLAHEAIATGEDNARLHELLGFLAAQRGDHALAVRHFGAAVALRPKAAGSWFSLAASLAETGDITAALAAIDAALEREEAPEFMLRKAQLLERAGDTGQAAAWYRRAAATASTEVAEAARARLRQWCADSSSAFAACADRSDAPEP